MKAAMILVLSVMLGLTMNSVRAADAHDHGQAATATKSEKVESLGGGKKCDKCKKNKSDGKKGCCCADMKDKPCMMHGEQKGGMDHNAMMERMQKMEARMSQMEKKMEQMGKPAPAQ